MLTEDELTILRTIYESKHPTTEQVHRFALPAKSRRSVELHLVHLRMLGLIDVHLLRPELGARSPRYYHLLLRGARTLGLSSLGSNHYRSESYEAFQARSARIELERLTHRWGWTLHAKETGCQAALRSFVVRSATSRHDEAFPGHTVSALLPSQIAPDLVLETSREAILCVIANPRASPAFWLQRIDRYAPLLAIARAVAVPLTPEQEAECRRIFGRSSYCQRVLVLDPAHLVQLETRLS